MITTIAIITCDSCNRKVESERKMIYRIDANANRLIDELKISGWLFRRNAINELFSVICPDCQGKNEVMA